MYATIRDLLKSAEQPLNIIEEYAALSPKRKVLLCDHYFVEGRETYENTVRLLWPEATKKDMKKLGNFLVLLKNTSH
ncbi:MAG: hypothetical protein H6937_13520 [Burkholderiales bacterium]|nr:hypothetical protein [Alphaproteobacteria bacterium]MCB9981810.1 hypothetical protein [Rhodospirillales bacterium]MCB9982142.1 hypothetical protein [Rhodospirillales bacterium]MCP5246907.1 hypothetical protein [Burkholderiales bacterium]